MGKTGCMVKLSRWTVDAFFKKITLLPVACCLLPVAALAACGGQR
jgi:hypothetical protein